MSDDSIGAVEDCYIDAVRRVSCHIVDNLLLTVLMVEIETDRFRMGVEVEAVGGCNQEEQ